MSKLILVGEAPVYGARGPNQALHPDFCSSGRRLLDYSGWLKAEYLEHTDRRNLSPTVITTKCPWSARNSKGWAAREALSIPAGAPVILLGHKVAEAFGAGDVEVLTWYTPPEPTMAHSLLPGRRVAVVPHPSGRNRWWNSPANRADARRFLRAMMDDRERGPEERAPGWGWTADLFAPFRPAPGYGA